MRRLSIALPALYFLGGIGVWIDFMRTNPDGLANIGLLLYVFPVTIAGLASGRLIGATAFPLIASSLGYWTAHALFFFPSLLAVTGGIGWLLSRIGRRGTQ